MKKNIIKILGLFLIIISFFIFINKVKATDEEIVIVLDAGHGGTDPGAQNTELEINEADLNIKVARYLKEYLNEYDGIKVLMTHNGIESSDYLALVDRGMFARNNNANILISLHFNANNIKLLYGAEIYVTADTSLDKYNKNSTKLANCILNRLSDLGIYNRGVKTRLSDESEEKYMYSNGTVADYYGVIRYPMKGDSEGLGVDISKGEGIPGMIIEHCFIRGNDVQFLDSEEDLKKLAKADCEGIVEYYGLKKKGEAVKSVSLDKTILTLTKDIKTKLTATISPETAINKNVTWKSSDENIAKVDQNGNVTAVRIGKATITVTTEDNKKVAKSTIIVKDMEIEVDKEYITMLKGEKTKIKTNIELSLKEDKIEMQSENPKIAEIDENGIITALNTGRTVINIKIKNTNILKKIIINVNELKNEQKVIIKDLKENYNTLSRIKEKTTLDKFMKCFKITDDLDIEIKNNKDYITTNTIVNIINKNSKEILKTYYCIVYGDTNRDGKITSSDYVLIKNHIMEINKLPIQVLDAADVNRDGKVSSSDYVLIKNHIMKGTDLKTE